MCGIAGLISRKRNRENGSRIKKGIVQQTERGNGLGAGYAAYGIYPEYQDLYALHIMAQNPVLLSGVPALLEESFTVHHAEEIPVWEGEITDHPVFSRLFVEPGTAFLRREESLSADDYTIEKIMDFNSRVEGGFIFSSGKNMGVFKGVGTPAGIYDFFQLDNYEGYTWLAHNRFPTNTPGWWGGAHPFNLLDWSVVHNGEISSYGINRRYLETFGYRCNMQTDSEVIAYLLDLLIRRHGLTIFEAAAVFAPNYWASVEREKDEDIRDRAIAFKTIYESAMLNGPFAVLAACKKGLFTITDNTKLRPMVIGHSGESSFFASETSALYVMEEGLDEVFTPRAGQPCLVELDEAVEARGDHYELIR